MYLGIDLGTSELKLLLLAPDHGVVAKAGAARLGWLAAGGAPREVLRDGGAAEQRFEPDPADAALLAARYQRFRALYPALAAEFRTG